MASSQVMSLTCGSMKKGPTPSADTYRDYVEAFLQKEKLQVLGI